MPRRFAGLGDPLARVCLIGGRDHSLGTGTPQFQTGSRPNVPLHHPRSVKALETLYLSRSVLNELLRGLSVKRLTCELSSITG